MGVFIVHKCGFDVHVTLIIHFLHVTDSFPVSPLSVAKITVDERHVFVCTQPLYMSPRFLATLVGARDFLSFSQIKW